MDFKKKEELQKEDVALTMQVEDTEEHYQDVYNSVNQLRDAYGSCKEHFALRRYGELKDMIKACIAKNSATDQLQKTGNGKIGVLRKKARYLSEVAATNAKVSGLREAEIVKDIKEKKKRKEKIDLMLPQLKQRLNELKRHYEESKQHLPMNRYGVMKEIIKTLIRDETLRIDST